MNIITHALIGWGVATAVPTLSRRERVWVVASAVAPDLDGLGIIAEIPTRNTSAPLFWWSEYHHLLAHNLFFAVLFSIAAAAFTRRTFLGLITFGSVNLHFLCDLVGSRGPDGYQWPLYYFWPFSERVALQLAWQWKLNAWPNVAISLLLLGYAFWFAYKYGSSPLEMVSMHANERFVSALRLRFPNRTS